MGCELRTLESYLEGPEGVTELRFLFNPENQTFAALPHLEDDEVVSPDEVGALERRLEMEIPKSWH